MNGLEQECRSFLFGLGALGLSLRHQKAQQHSLLGHPPGSIIVVRAAVSVLEVRAMGRTRLE